MSHLIMAIFSIMLTLDTDCLVSQTPYEDEVATNIICNVNLLRERKVHNYVYVYIYMYLCISTATVQYHNVHVHRISLSP